MTKPKGDKAKPRSEWLQTGMLREHEKNTIAKQLHNHTIKEIADKLNRSEKVVFKYARKCLRDRWLRMKTEGFSFSNIKDMENCPDEMREQAEIEWNHWMRQFNGDCTATDSMMICDVIKIGFFERDYYKRLKTIQDKIKTANASELYDLTKERDNINKELLSLSDLKRKSFNQLKVTRAQRDANLKTNENMPDWVKQVHERDSWDRTTFFRNAFLEENKRLEKHKYPA